MAKIPKRGIMVVARAARETKDYEKVPQDDPDPADPGESASRAPSRRGPAALPTTDSFILTQLREWRLLSGTALNGEEWRSIPASAKNQLDHDSVSSALMILFDEQAQHHRQPHATPPSHSLHTVEEEDWSWNDDVSSNYDPWAFMAWENGDGIHPTPPGGKEGRCNLAVLLHYPPHVSRRLCPRRRSPNHLPLLGTSAASPWLADLGGG